MFSLRYINLAPGYEDVWGSGGIHLCILNLGTRGELSASRPDRFTSKERAPGTHWIGAWVGPTAGLDTVKKRRTSCPCWESKPDSSMAIQTSIEDVQSPQATHSAL
jgi:hypothetical protein